MAFELTSNDAGLLERATVVFSPWIRKASESRICRWRIERSSVDTEANGANANGANAKGASEDTWVVSLDNEPTSSVHTTPDAALLSVEYNSVVKCIKRRGHLGLHAALLSNNGKGVVIVGRPESGKSTLACALWQHGWSLLCDDYVLIDAERRSACPTPRRVSLRPGSRELLGEKLWSQILAAPSCGRTQKSYVFHPSDLDGNPQATCTDLAAVIFLARGKQETAAADWCRVEPAHALLSLLPYSNLLSQFDQGEAIRRMLPLANSVPVFDVKRKPLGKMVECIEQLVEP